MASDAYLAAQLVRDVESSVRAALLPPGARKPKPAEPTPTGATPREATTAAAARARGRIGALLQALGLLIHALGELLRAMLSPRETHPPLRQEEGKATAAPAHWLEVRAVLDSLGIAYDSDAGKTWLWYAGLPQPHTRACPLGPGLPRPADLGFRRYFGRLVAMLDVVLERHEARYLSSVDRLDALARIRRPGDEHARVLRQEFSQDPVTMERFFSRLTSSAWLRPLREQAFFAEPPVPVAAREGPGWLPDWPALRYLVRVADRSPALAVEVAMGIPATGNQLLNAGLVNLALEVPAAKSVTLLPRIKRDLAGSYEAAGAEQLSALVLHLADGGMADAALDLASALWAFTASPGEVIPGTAGGLRTRIGTRAYAESLRTCLRPLVSAGGPAVLETLADLLDDAITRSASPAMIEDRQDLSALWRPALEGQPADTDMDVKTALVSAVRDAAEQLARDRRIDVEYVLRRMESRDWPVFR